MLAKLERAFPTPVILDSSASPVPNNPSTPPANLPIIHIVPSSSAVDPPMAFTISHQTSQLSTGSPLHGLSIAPSRFMVPLFSTSPAMSTTKQKSFKRFV